MGESKWIPVNKNEISETMPNKDCDVWVTRKNSKRTWTQKVFYEVRIGYFQFEGVVAWMPYIVPEPYIKNKVS